MQQAPCWFISRQIIEDVTRHDVATNDDPRLLGTSMRGEISRAMGRQVRWMGAVDTALAALTLTAARLLF